MHDRSVAYARHLWLAVVPLFVLISVESFFVRPDVPARAAHNPICWLALLVTLISTAVLISSFSTRREMRAFLASNFLIAGLLTTGGAAIFPVMLHSTLAPENSLSAYAIAANHTALVVASIWWPIAFALAVGYFIFISCRYVGKVSVKRDNQGFY